MCKQSPVVFQNIANIRNNEIDKKSKTKNNTHILHKKLFIPYLTVVAYSQSLFAFASSADHDQPADARDLILVCGICTMVLIA